MSIKSLQDYTYYSRYARYNGQAKRRETWGEANDRVKEMHLRKYAGCGSEVADEIEWAFELVKQKRILGSQRALQFGGTPIEKKNARIYNCTVSFCDRIRFFQECFWLLLCGCGTGFSVQKHHVAKLPKFHRSRVPGQAPLNLVRETRKYLIPDTIEGWSDALGILLATYFEHPEFKEWLDYNVEFDYSLIRPAGSMLASGVGKAPGSEPLKKALEIIRGLLDERIGWGLDHLRPIDAYDIIMHASDAVLSGGVRRSATICIFSLEDQEMAKAKTGNWFNENPQRGRSNNSALLLRDGTTREDFMNLINSVKEYGEPGFYWSDSTEQLPNPCVEIGMWPVDITTGESGWQMCNLTEINGRKIKCKEDFAIAARAGAIIGTLQAGYTDFDYLGPVTKRIVEREALLGVSMTGMMDNPKVIFNPKIQQEMAQLVLDTNAALAAKIGINPAARATCVKPAGTTSCILGSSSGVHPHHAKRYFRRVQGNSMETVLQYFKQFNPSAVERSVWSANHTEESITFCIEVPDGAKTKNDLSAIELLEYVKLTQQNWVAYGKRNDACTQPWLSHNVSNTINIRPDEWDDVSEFIYKNRKWFAGISLLPQSGDLDYPQAPMCNVLNSREILQEYGEGSLLASGLVVDGLHAFDGNLWTACEVATGLSPMPTEPEKPKMKEVENPNNIFDPTPISTCLTENKEWKKNHAAWQAKVDWVRRVKQFADRYCSNDVRKCSYLLKHVNNWKLWLDLRREYKDIDYTQLTELEDNTRPMDTIACAGGACELR